MLKSTIYILVFASMTSAHAGALRGRVMEDPVKSPETTTLPETIQETNPSVVMQQTKAEGAAYSTQQVKDIILSDFGGTPTNLPRIFRRDYVRDGNIVVSLEYEVHLGVLRHHFQINIGNLPDERLAEFERTVQNDLGELSGIARIFRPTTNTKEFIVNTLARRGDWSKSQTAGVFEVIDHILKGRLKGVAPVDTLDTTAKDAFDDGVTF